MKTILIITFHFFALFSFADAWDNLTREEAEKVVAELEKNPFIFDYCDCCDFSGEYATEVHFLKVTGTEIVPCDWNAEFFSVKYQADVIAKVSFNEIGESAYQLQKVENENTSGTFYMNYTWGWNANRKKATPFFDFILYDYYGEGRSCHEPILFPTPLELRAIQRTKGYKKWYRSAID